MKSYHPPVLLHLRKLIELYQHTYDFNLSQCITAIRADVASEVYRMRAEQNMKDHGTIEGGR